jgi:hypothetical protein
MAAPPPGATQISSKPITGGTYVGYRTTQTPSAIVSYYHDALQSSGWSITSTGGGGGGGGNGGGVSAQKGGRYASINAGGYAGTYYIDACAGTNKQAVDNCGSNAGQDNNSNQDHNQNSQNNQNNQNDDNQNDDN